MRGARGDRQRTGETKTTLSDCARMMSLPVLLMMLQLPASLGLVTGQQLTAKGSDRVVIKFKDGGRALASVGAELAGTLPLKTSQLAATTVQKKSKSCVQYRNCSIADGHDYSNDDGADATDPPNIPQLSPLYQEDLSTFCFNQRDCVRGLECYQKKCVLYGTSAAAAARLDQIQAAGKGGGQDYEDKERTCDILDPTVKSCKDETCCPRLEYCVANTCIARFKCSIQFGCPRCYNCTDDTTKCIKPPEFPVCREEDGKSHTTDGSSTDVTPADYDTTAVNMLTTPAGPITDPSGIVCEVPRFQKEAPDPKRHRGWYLCNSQLDDSLKKFKTSEKWRCAIDHQKELLFCICTALRDACTLKFNSNPDFLGTKTAIIMQKSAKKAKKKKKSKADDYVDDDDDGGDDGDDADDDDDDGGSDYSMKKSKKKKTKKTKKKKKVKPRTRGKAKPRGKGKVNSRAGTGLATGKTANALDSTEEYLDPAVLKEQEQCTKNLYRTSPDNGWTFCGYDETMGYMKRWRKCFKHRRGNITPFIGDSSVSLDRIQKEKKLRYVEDPLNFDLRRADMAKDATNLVCLCRCGSE